MLFIAVSIAFPIYSFPSFVIIYNYQQQNDLRKQLLVIKNLADNYPNSGSLNKALNNFDKDLQNILTMKDKNLLCTTELVSIYSHLNYK
jgi:hypothetical protein